MHKTVVAWTTGFGVLAIILTLLWSYAGAGLYGSPFAHFHGSDLVLLLLMLLLGPLSILPIGLIGRKRPGIAGIWLIALSLASFGLTFAIGGSWRLGQILAVAAAYAPFLILGSAFIKVWFDVRRAACGRP